MTAQRIPTQVGGTSTCRSCGTTVAAPLARVSGVWTRFDDATTWDCESCTLLHIREIESGTDPTHW